MELSRRSLLAIAGVSLIPTSRLFAADMHTVPSIDRPQLTVLEYDRGELIRTVRGNGYCFLPDVVPG